MAARDAAAAVDAVLEADESAEFDRSEVRGMIVRLGAAAESGLTDPRLAVGGFVDALLELRSRARAGQRWDEADYIRDRLTELGVTVTDTEDGVEWDLVLTRHPSTQLHCRSGSSRSSESGASRRVEVDGRFSESVTSP